MPMLLFGWRNHYCIIYETVNNALYDVRNVSLDGQHAALHRGVDAEIWMAESRDEAERAFDRFIATFSAKYLKATECLVKDCEWLLAFYDFPAEHWTHIRSTNVIESTFATIRHRSDRAKGA